jgi:hypothetical protein
MGERIGRGKRKRERGEGEGRRERGECSVGEDRGEKRREGRGEVFGAKSFQGISNSVSEKVSAETELLKDTKKFLRKFHESRKPGFLPDLESDHVIYSWDYLYLESHAINEKSKISAAKFSEYLSLGKKGNILEGLGIVSKEFLRLFG